MDVPVLICMRVEEMDGAPAEGSVQLECMECGAAIWAARSSQELLAPGDDFRLVCMHCANELTRTALAAEAPDQSAQAQIERLRSNAEAAYDSMYALRDEREIRWQFELADDLLREAVKTARESAMPDEANAIESRRQHIRQVYFHQFVQPPHLLM
jgi:uncharacterized Zn finger protein (UPF0148 family)